MVTYNPGDLVISSADDWTNGVVRCEPNYTVVMFEPGKGWGPCLDHWAMKDNQILPAEVSW